MKKVAKFGGSSLANSEQVRKVIKIIQSDPTIQTVVVSAPGKQNPKDDKITDLLYAWHENASSGLPYQEFQEKICDRFTEIIFGLNLKIDISKEILLIESNIINGGSCGYTVSRGEYFMGSILAQALGFEYVDPRDCIKFDSDGNYLDRRETISRYLADKRAVISGFYGGTEGGICNIRTFSRGGSDLTGALVAQALNADVYENWTDVSGLLMCDPRIVKNPLPVEQITYEELREMSYMGANVFHEEAMFPLIQSKIPTNIRNTNEPSHPGTTISASLTVNPSRVITGIAGRTGFSVIRISKTLMNKELGFARKVLSVLEKEGVCFEHMPGGIDNLSIIIDEKFLKDKSDLIISKIREAVNADKVTISTDMAMIAVVGRSMVSTPGVAAQIISAIAKKYINIEMINQGSSEINIIIGVQEVDYENAIRAIYESVV